MKQPIHTLIVGEQGVGKSTLIRRVLEEVDVSICGFETRKEDGLADAVLGSPLYIYEAGKPHVQTADNLAGHCKDKKPVVYVQGFDRFAEKLEQLAEENRREHWASQENETIQGLTRDRLILMDEIGVMECQSERFCSAILELLNGDTPILAAVKYKNRPFLEKVRSHPNCRCFTITPENRAALYEDVLAFVQAQISGSK